MLSPAIILGCDKAKPKVIKYEPTDGSDHKVYGMYDKQPSCSGSCETSDRSCDCADGDDSSTTGTGTGAENGAGAGRGRRRKPCGSEADAEDKEAIRDELMIMKGGVRLLREQYNDLRCKLQNSVIVLRRPLGVVIHWYAETPGRVYLPGSSRSSRLGRVTHAVPVTIRSTQIGIRFP